MRRRSQKAFPQRTYHIGRWAARSRPLFAQPQHRACGQQMRAVSFGGCCEGCYGGSYGYWTQERCQPQLQNQKVSYALGQLAYFTHAAFFVVWQGALPQLVQVLAQILHLKVWNQKFRRSSGAGWVV